MLNISQLLPRTASDMACEDDDQSAPVPPQLPPYAETPECDNSSMGGTSSGSGDDEEDSMLVGQWVLQNGVWEEQKPGINGWYRYTWNPALGKCDNEPVWVWHEPMPQEAFPARNPDLPDHDPEDVMSADDESESGCPVSNLYNKLMYLFGVETLHVDMVTGHV